jgi:ribosome-binding factor A
MNSFKRADRVADLIRTEISDLLLKQVRDPRIGFVTITGVKVTDDLRTARVFFVELGKDQCSEERLRDSSDGSWVAESGSVAFRSFCFPMIRLLPTGTGSRG